MPQRTLSEQEFNAIGQKLMADAPAGLSESDFQRWIGSRFAAAVGEAENTPAAPEGSALGRFVSNAGEMLNPIAAVKGIAQAVAHPVETARNIGRASMDQGRQALDAAREGRVSEAVGHGLGMFPVIGPAVAEAGEQIASGDIAGGLGRGVGLLIPTGAPAAVRGTAAAVRRVVPQGVKAAVAGSLERGAATRVADVMSPKVGPNKTRFANKAVDVAPDLVAEPSVAGGWSRDALHGKVTAKLEEASAALDDAANARLSARTFPTKPLIDGLLEKRRRLTAETVDASDATTRPTAPLTRRTDMGIPGAGNRGGAPTTRTVAAEGGPLGKDVVPGPNAGRVAEIDRAIAELKQLGPVARYEPIRRIREAYDGPAKAVYNPSMTADFLKAQGSKMGAADVTGVLRDQLAKWDPQTAKANAGYSLYKSAHDVLEAAAEAERARPTMFRRTMTRVAGASAGGGLGLLIAEVSEQLASAGWTTKLKSAQTMAKLAKAIQKGDSGYAATLANQLKRIGAQAATVVGTTSPSGLQNQTTAPAR